MLVVIIESFMQKNANIGDIFNTMLSMEGTGALGIKEIVLPIGISFFTFQAMSYVFDVYTKKTKIQENIFYFALYVSLFPQLIAGPIVKYSDIDLQLSYRKESRDLFVSGKSVLYTVLVKRYLFQIFWQKRTIIMKKRLLSIILSVAMLLAVPFSIRAFEAEGNFRLDELQSGQNLKILVIGNSLSVDTTTFLYDIFKGAGHTVTVGNYYHGSRQLNFFYEGIKTDSADSTFRKNSDGDFAEFDNFTLKQALQNEVWDIVVLQQGTIASGLDKYYYNEQEDVNYVTYMANFCRENALNENLKIGYQIGWPIREYTDKEEYLENFTSTDQLFKEGCDRVKERVIKEESVDFIVPANTAVSNLVTSYIGEDVFRDASHLSYGLGRFFAGMTMAYCCGMDLNGIERIETTSSSNANLYEPYLYSNLNLQVLKNSIVNAVEKPFTITEQTAVAPRLNRPTMSAEATEPQKYNISWQGEGATSYQIWRKIYGEDKYKLVTAVEGDTTSYVDTVSSKQKGKTALYYVSAIGDNYISGATSNIQKVCPTPKLEVAIKSGGVELSWNNCKGISGVNIYRKKGSGSYILIKTLGSKETLFIDAYPKQVFDKYTYYIETFSNTDNSITAKSAKKGICYLYQNSIQVKSSKKRHITIKWTKNTNATGYQIVYTTDKNFGRKKTVTVYKNKNTLKVKKSKVNYYVKVRTFAKIGNKKYYSPYSKVKKLKVK